MAIYIWLLFQNIVISCIANACSVSTNDHLGYLLQIGMVEVIFEIGGIIKIFVKKDKL